MLFFLGVRIKRLVEIKQLCIWIFHFSFFTFHFHKTEVKVK